jgi:hypothetical protein
VGGYLLSRFVSLPDLLSFVVSSAERHFAFCHCEHLKGARQSHIPHEIASADFVSLAMTKGGAQQIGQLHF